MAKNNKSKKNGKTIRHGKKTSMDEVVENSNYTYGFAMSVKDLKASPEFNSKDFIFQGTLVGGLDIDIFALTGLDLSYDDIERITDQISRRDLIVNVLDVEEIELYEVDDSPMHSDTYYEYRCGDYDEFVNKLSEWIVKFLDD
jgi:hypothetical protein